MLDERIIRAHADDLLALAARECTCRGQADRVRCAAGKVMMAQSARCLFWALGDHLDYDRVVETMAAERRALG